MSGIPPLPPAVSPLPLLPRRYEKDRDHAHCGADAQGRHARPAGWAGKAAVRRARWGWGRHGYDAGPSSVARVEAQVGSAASAGCCTEMLDSQRSLPAAGGVAAASCVSALGTFRGKSGLVRSVWT